jgi:hypothetical protein
LKPLRLLGKIFFHFLPSVISLIFNTFLLKIVK